MMAGRSFFEFLTKIELIFWVGSVKATNESRVVDEFKSFNTPDSKY